MYFYNTEHRIHSLFTTEILVAHLHKTMLGIQVHMFTVNRNDMLTRIVYSLCTQR